MADEVKERETVVVEKGKGSNGLMVGLAVVLVVLLLLWLF